MIYGAAFELKSALSYDFEQERSFIYENISQDEFIKHLCFFVSRLWQIHAFGEGNTRTTAVFIIKYLRSLGFKVNNEPFESHSWYFRNALVRANYKNVKKGICEDISYLELFFRNLLLGEKHQLRNRYMHLRFDKNLPINTENLPINMENLPINTENLPINQVQQELAYHFWLLQSRTLSIENFLVYFLTPLQGHQVFEESFLFLQELKTCRSFL